VQHPGALRLDDNENATSVADAGSNWPDFSDGLPARRSLVAITKQDKGVVGS
jgi:secreted PhoX family phosphatase